MDEPTISDALARIQNLENRLAGIKDAPAQVGAEQWVFFPETIPLIYDNPSSTTDWIDSGCGKHIPPEAKRAIVFAAVEDTDGGTGRSYLEARGGGVQRIIASIYEPASGANESSASGDVFVPLSEGRFDYRATITAAANIRIELVGYML